MKTIIGIDLAWGSRMPDALVKLEGTSFTDSQYLQGDEAFFEYLDTIPGPLLLAIDAPTLCINEMGSRPVDKECSALFRKQEAGCHPVNRKLCQRPLEIAERLAERGIELSSVLTHTRHAIEVYPHPAMVRFFGLEKTIKYKRGKVAEKRVEFALYQELFRSFLARDLPELIWNSILEECLDRPWSKRVEDLLDAYLCACIGYWHEKYQGKRSEILGDPVTGEMLLPVP